jgi:hypothetical protein
LVHCNRLGKGKTQTKRAREREREREESNGRKKKKKHGNFSSLPGKMVLVHYLVGIVAAPVSPY